jgi:hypothetical protein
MEIEKIIDIFNGICERCLMQGIIHTLEEAKILCDTFDRFKNKKYKNDEEYSRDILYFYNLSVKLHESGNTTLEESYSIYTAILESDRIDFIETDNQIDDVIIEHVKIDSCNNEYKEDDGIVDISDIIIS